MDNYVLSHRLTIFNFLTIQSWICSFLLNRISSWTSLQGLRKTQAMNRLLQLRKRWIYFVIVLSPKMIHWQQIRWQGNMSPKQLSTCLLALQRKKSSIRENLICLMWHICYIYFICGEQKVRVIFQRLDIPNQCKSGKQGHTLLCCFYRQWETDWRSCLKPGQALNLFRFNEKDFFVEPQCSGYNQPVLWRSLSRLLVLFVKLPNSPQGCPLPMQETSFRLFHLLALACCFTPQSLCRRSVTGWATQSLALMDPALPVGNKVTVWGIMLWTVPGKVKG